MSAIVSRRAALGATIGGVALAWAGAARAAYPDRPIRWVVPYAAGGGTDVMARLIATEMSSRLAQPVVVENRPGAGTNIGTEAVARSAPDGYTVLSVDSAALVFNAALFRRLPFDPENDFRPVGMFARVPLVLAVGRGVPDRSLQDFVTRARAKPGQIDYASPGIGSPHHLVMELLQKITGIRLNHIPYRGTGPAMNDVVAGNVESVLVNYASSAEMFRTGQVRPLAIASGRRLASLPDVPTLTEALGEEMQTSNWQALVVPRAVPDDVAARLTAALLDTMRQPAMQARFREMGLDPAAGTPDEFERVLAADRRIWPPLIRTLGISMDG
ncbi:Bug family tripartite tricarboxylate transporter substrate binding protein [Roseomonas populi]|uniref:Tripartite tricarboxylate transporter substrate binding protein n=1 Tax=Roseomonas populi TaxID=3121582 RepID=A0ABT1XB79_9PROT|nr:tripartite tricarboxylate transporter substrate binding protein [Roseomonas pecuniae]MCR0985006.1 tripartite tricarboxylate transporter substrate binding protein [Roseomonas pecuniae]